MGKVRNLGRRVALSLVPAVDPDDGEQEAVVVALDLERETASLARPLVDGAFLNRVHARLIGGKNNRKSPLRKFQPLVWEGNLATEITDDEEGDDADL